MGNRPGFGKIVFTVIVIALAVFFFLRETDYCDQTRRLDELVLDAAGVQFVILPRLWGDTTNTRLGIDDR